MIADMVEPEKRVDAYALMRMIANLGVSIGPAVGGFIATGSYALAFYLAAGAHVIFSLLIILFVAETMPEEEEGEAGSRSYLPVLRDRPFMTFMTTLVVAAMPAPIMFVLLPVYIKEQFGIPESGFGIMMSTNAFMVVTLQYLTTRFSRRFRPPPVLAVGAIFYALGAGSVGWGRAFPAFMISMAVLTVGEMLIFPTATALTANLAPPDMRARYMGVYNLTWAVGIGIAPVIGGLLNDQIAPVAMWYGALTLGLAGALGFVWLERSGRRREAWSQPGLEAPEGV